MASTLECQVCSFRERLEYEEWFVHQIEAGDFVYRVLTCSRCNRLEDPEIFAGFKARIRRGEDQDYH